MQQTPARPQFDPPRCAYCNGPASMGFNRDHVVPNSLQKKLRKQGVELSPELCVTVWSCFPCNIRKGTRKLVPPSWADKIPALKEAIPGKWRVWSGNPKEAAYTEGWK